MSDNHLYKYDISILIPFFNEKENLETNFSNVQNTLSELPLTAEVIYVNDGSTDGGEKLIEALSGKDKHVKLINFARNYGQTAAFEAAFSEAQGNIYITLDADNQNDPRDIPLLLEKISAGYDVVSGWRKNRQDGFLLRKIPSFFANRLISCITGVTLKDYGCSLKAYRALYVKRFHLYGEMHRFIPAFAKYAGAQITEVPVRHHARIKGHSKYGIMRTYKVLLDLITVKFLGDYVTKPLYFFGGMGFIFMLGSFFVALFVLWQKFFHHIWVHKNPLFILSLFIFLLGVVMIMMGLLAELLMRTYHESQNKKSYYIASKHGFGD